MNTATDEMRARLQGVWATVAPAWGANADLADHHRADLIEQMLAKTTPRPGDRVLELACGPAGVGLAVAELVAPEGEVVLSDAVAEMTAVAAARARARGLHNVSTRKLDLEAIAEPDESYDVVVCQDGLMFALDPARAAREIDRILRPGGRFALTVWGPRESNPWLSVVFDVVAAQFGRPVPPPGVPGPFSLDDADALAALLDAAGLSDVEVVEQAAPVAYDSFEHWWETTRALAGPIASILAALPENAAQALRERARAAVASSYETPRGLEFPGLALLASGREGGS